MRRHTAIIVMVVALAGGWTPAKPEEPTNKLELSPEVAKLLREEMQEITVGVQGVTLALASGDWDTIVETSDKIRASYILNKKLTDAQVEELESKLSHGFKALDQEFHERAAKLGAAAEARDAELAAFHLYRMIESCATCHAAHASSRFPGFAGEDSEAEDHHHH